jgi:hypothetical protein
VKRRWRCVPHFLFSCKTPPPACPDPTDLWLDLLDLLPCDAVAAAQVQQALHVDSFGPADVRRFCMPWLLDPFCFLSACPCSVFVTVCSIIAGHAGPLRSHPCRLSPARAPVCHLLCQRLSAAISGTVPLPVPYTYGCCGPAHRAHALRLDAWRAPCHPGDTSLMTFVLLRTCPYLVFDPLVGLFFLSPFCY